MLREYFLTTGRMILLIWILFVVLVDADYGYWYSMITGIASAYLLAPLWAFKQRTIPKGKDYDVFNVIGGTVLFMVAYSLFMLEM